VSFLNDHASLASKGQRLSAGKHLKSHFTIIYEEESDLLSLVVKAHYSIDELLNIVLLEALPKADAVELKRVSFLLKVDFVIGLGILRSDLRPIFNKINAIRNSFAHNPYWEFSEKDALNTVNILAAPRPKVLPDDCECPLDPLKVLKTLLGVGFINLTVAYERYCVGKAKMQVVNQMATEVVANGKRRGRERHSVQEEFEERVRSYLNEHFPGIKES
jgi:hypothetical protein